MSFISRKDVFEQVNQMQLDKLMAEFNTRMTNPTWVSNWKCGTPEDPFWRFGDIGSITPATERELTKQLTQMGWHRITFTHSYEDRGESFMYTVYANPHAPVKE